LTDALLRYARARGCYLSIDDHRAANVEISSMFDEHKILAPTMLVTLHQLGLHVALQSGNADAVRQAIVEACSLPARIELPYIENEIELLDLIEIGLAGDPEQYEAASAALLEYNLDSGDAEAFFIYEADLMCARLMQCRTSELLGDIERIIAEHPDTARYQAVAALFHAEAGNLVRSADLLARAHERGLVEGSNVCVVQSLDFWGGVAARVGNLAPARVLYNMLEPFSGQFLSNMTQLTQPVGLTLGRLCTAPGRFDDAARFLENFAVTAQQFEAPWMTARTVLCQAVLATADG
jgi:hypothetical protein